MDRRAIALDVATVSGAASYRCRPQPKRMAGASRAQCQAARPAPAASFHRRDRPQADGRRALRKALDVPMIVLASTLLDAMTTPE
jgi:hypothetical protein